MLTKQPFLINFAQGLDTKTDPFQLAMGSFLSLQNSVFTKGKRLTKRNGYGSLASLPYAASFITTFNNDLTAIGTSIQAYSTGSNNWVSKGQYQPLTENTLPLIRNNLNQSQADTAIASNGNVCTVYTEDSDGTLSYKYAIADSVTGQNLFPPTVIPNANATYGTPRVFLLENYFIIVFTVEVISTYNLVFLPISINSPYVSGIQTTISTNYQPVSPVGFDGTVISSFLYLAWNGASSSGIQAAYVTSSLVVSGTVTVDSAHQATDLSVCGDIQESNIGISYYYTPSTNGYTVTLNTGLSFVHTAVESITGVSDVINLASAAQNGIITLFYEVGNVATGITTDYISSTTIDENSGVVTSPVVVLRSVGLASKAFIWNGTIYVLGAYEGDYNGTSSQPTYFLINGSESTSAVPLVIGKLAYSNGGGYVTTGLPSVTVIGSTAYMAYLYADLIQPISNANQSGTEVNPAVYTQTGINLGSFTFGSQGLVTSEIGSNLNISGGFLWAYDGYSLTEQGFHLYPDSVQKTATATTGGFMAAQIYYYQVTYESTDNQGNIFRSAGSIPIKVDLSGSGTSTNTVTLVIPTLRITAKINSPVRIAIYRWSTANQSFYQTTNFLDPLLNNTTIDNVTFVDTNSDATIVGNNLIYTNGGVIEDTGAPASSAMTLFDDRLWLVDSEDQNLLWFSKQVIEATPVEMSDLLTVYVAPTIGATGPTGPITALSAMDDKLIIFKKNASYYINGTGPDNTGANNQYSQPTFVTSMVGCSNQRSIVFQPQGLMFEFSSESGNQIWLLSRDLSTQYIGASVEGLTQGATVLSSIAVPGTNQVRFNLSSGITLMYDYYYGQWGTFSTNGISSVLYQGLHTYLSPNGSIFQETPGLYLDGSNPVLMSFTTSWVNVAGIRGYQRSFFFYLLGQYLTPFKLQLSIAYDYNMGPESFAMIAPTNFNPTYGGTESNGQMTVYGSDTPYGGQSNILNWRVFMKKQRCSSFQINLQEIYDPSFGVVAGAGFTLSGLSLICAIKSGFKTISSGHSVGAS